MRQEKRRNKRKGGCGDPEKHSLRSLEKGFPRRRGCGMLLRSQDEDSKMYVGVGDTEATGDLQEL